MIKLSLDERKVSKALKDISKYSKKIQEGVRKQVITSALTIETNAKKNAPVDTGRLRASIVSDIKPNGASVGTNVEYAPDVEFGTVRYRGQPFLFPAWNLERPKFISSLKMLLKK